MGAQDIIPYRFKPGQSGNPKGRKKGSKFADEFLKALNKKAKVSENVIKALSLDASATWSDVIVAMFVEKAARGSVRHFQEIGDRLDPKPKPSEIADNDEVKVIKSPRWSAINSLKNKKGT